MDAQEIGKEKEKGKEKGEGKVKAGRITLQRGIADLSGISTRTYKEALGDTMILMTTTVSMPTTMMIFMTMRMTTGVRAQAT